MESFRQFCEAVCAQVRCHAVHKEIIRELTAHLEDKADALMARGFSQEEAEAQAVAAMGDPEAVGKELDQVHPPVWGILSGLSGVALLLTGLFLLVAGYGLFLRPVVDTAREFLHVVQAKTQLPDGTQGQHSRYTAGSLGTGRAGGSPFLRHDLDGWHRFSAVCLCGLESLPDLYAG